MSTPIALWLAEKLEDPESAHGYRLVANNAADELRRLHQENEQLKAQADQSISCQCPACEKTSHASDCAVHNAPAYPVGECDCGAQPYPENFIDALKYDVARRDSDQKDAARWRFLVDNSFDKDGVTQFHVWEHSWEPHSQTGESTEWKQRVRGPALDRFIDRAIEAKLKENT